MYFNLEELKNKGMDEQVAKEIILLYSFYSPIKALNKKFTPEIQKTHEEFSNWFVDSLKHIEDRKQLRLFVRETLPLKAEETSINVAKYTTTKYIRDNKLASLSEQEVDCIREVLGKPLEHLLKYLIQNEMYLEKKEQANLMLGDDENVEKLEGLMRDFWNGCEWAKDDNNKVAKQIHEVLRKDKFDDIDYQDFVNNNALNYIRFPLYYENYKNEFLSYINRGCDILSQEYGIERDNIGMNTIGLELFTTYDTAMFVPYFKNIYLRLDFITAFLHEYTHALDHVSALATFKNEEHYMVTEWRPVKEDYENSHPLTKKILDFVRDIKTVNAYSDEKSMEEFKEKLANITARFLLDIPKQLEESPEKFKETFEKIMDKFKTCESKLEFEKFMGEELKSHLGEHFKVSNINFYVEITKQMQGLYQKPNNLSLYYNLSKFNDIFQKYFSSSVEMFARIMENHFFRKYDDALIPSERDVQSHIFYPQPEEYDLLKPQIESLLSVFRENSALIQNKEILKPKVSYKL